MSEVKTLRLGLLGLGNIGAGLVELVRKNEALYLERSRVRIEFAGALIKDLHKLRPVNSIRLTTDPADILRDPSIDVIVELLGGIEPARTLVIEALRRGKNVVTANKSLLAEHGAEIFELAAGLTRSVGFEASVCGGIPLIRVLNSGLVANHIERIYGILNGTSNFILTRMHREGCSYSEALKEAQQLGFAEPDPHNDVAGVDAAQKLSVLAGLAFGKQVAPSLITTEGIEEITSDDVAVAGKLGYRIKLLAFAGAYPTREREGAKRDFRLDLRVHPAFIPQTHPLANVNDEFNAVFIRGDAISEMMLYGKGAGRFPTASALLSDLVEIAHGEASIRPVGMTPTKESFNSHKEAGSAPGSIRQRGSAPPSRYYLRVSVPDRPGAIGKVTTLLGKLHISISHATATLLEKSGRRGQVTILTHQTPAMRIQQAKDVIRHWPELHAHPLAIPIFEE